MQRVGCRAEVLGCRAYECRWVRECREQGVQRAQGFMTQLQGAQGCRAHECREVSECKAQGCRKCRGAEGTGVQGS